ncbi:MAG: hypothetical protein VKP62_06535, partial [Candidatus Sericytochromatia bacterium]|nr:hypothetical protein [Candidatus Sericytochromatia bacterium]
RLFRRGVACFEGDRLHAHPRIVGEVGFVDAPLVHHAYDTVGEYIAKTRAYTDHEARVRVADGERRRLRDVWLAALRHVWYRGWKLGGYRDGWVGMRYVLVTALYPVWETWKIWRQQPRRRM